MFLSHPPKFLQRIYNSLVWNESTDNNQVYLTFDDGPTPGVTEEVLLLLKQHKAKATFFCLGKNVEKHNELYQKIIAAGHRIGNHSYHHPNGWKTNNADYLKDVMLASEVIDSKLFRPPYGKIKSGQIRRLRKIFKIIMWSTLTRDYDHTMSKEQCVALSLKNLDPGAILVFHDSIKAKEKMLYVLGKVLDSGKSKGINFESIPN